MAIDWDNYYTEQDKLKASTTPSVTPTPVQNTVPTPTSTTSPITNNQPQFPNQTISQYKPPTIFQGGVMGAIGHPIRTLFEAASVGQYAVAGAESKLMGNKAYNNLSYAGAIMKGMAEKRSNIEVDAEANPEWASAHPYKNAASGLLKDIILDPMWLIPPAKGVSLLSKAAKLTGIGRTLSETMDAAKIGEKVVNLGAKPLATGLTKWQSGVLSLTTKFGRPIGSSEVLPDALTKVAQQTEIGIGLADKVNALGKKGIDEIHDIVTGKLVEGSTPEVTKLGLEVKTAFNDYGQKLNELGKLTNESLNKYKGQYLPQFYEEFFVKPTNTIGQTVKNIFKAKETKVPVTTLKARTMTEEEAVASGFTLANTPFRIAKGIGDEAKVVELSKAFNFISENWSKSTQEINTLMKQGENVAGWVKMPSDVKQWGKLSSQFVPSALWYDLNRVGRSQGDVSKLWNEFYGVWKAGKTIYNPATHVRNMMSNVILNDMGGLSPLRVDIYGKAIKEYLTKGELYQEAKKVGFGVGGYFGNEIERIGTAVSRGEGRNFMEKLVDGSKGLSSIAEIPGNVYQAEEDLGKLAHYIYKRSTGLSPEESIKESKKWLFDYKRVPSIIDTIRKSPVGSPFVTFQYKVMPRIAETLMTNPTAISKYGKLINATESLTSSVDEKRAWLADYMKDSSYVALPAAFNDEDGRTKYLNLGSVLPWGSADTSMFIPGSPIIKAFQDLNSKADKTTGSHIDSFTGMEIWNDTDSATQQWEKKVNYLTAQLVPSLFPDLIPGGLSSGGTSYEKLRLTQPFQKLKAAITGSILPEDQVYKDYYGRKYNLLDTVLETSLGIKTTKVDFSKEQGYREAEAKNRISTLTKKLNSAMYSQARNPQIQNVNEQQKKIDDIQKQIDDIYAEFNALPRIP